MDGPGDGGHGSGGKEVLQMTPRFLLKQQYG